MSRMTEAVGSASKTPVSFGEAEAGVMLSADSTNVVGSRYREQRVRCRVVVSQEWLTSSELGVSQIPASTLTQSAANAAYKGTRRQ